ncbi:MAG TPA: LAGLIDADG family homing endonuclease [archaeon]|nr:LAGLIDADG family homing endonuclease [archaeon]
MEKVITVDENLASIHAYLCADGYFTSGKLSSKHKYYVMALRNTNQVLLTDFQAKFNRVFGIVPKIYAGSRSIVHNKELYFLIKRAFTSFYSNEWNFPADVFTTRALKAAWLRTIFDCEGWVTGEEDREIGLEMINLSGVLRIKKLLEEFEIPVIFKIKKNGKIFRLNIFGKENFIKFQNQIGFLHPRKKLKLQEVIDSYVSYEWIFPEDKELLSNFIIGKLKEKLSKSRLDSRKRIRICSCRKSNLEKLHLYIKEFYNVESIVSDTMFSGIGVPYFELSINKKSSVEKIKSLLGF